MSAMLRSRSGGCRCCGTWNDERCDDKQAARAEIGAGVEEYEAAMEQA